MDQRRDISEAIICKKSRLLHAVQPGVHPPFRAGYKCIPGEGKLLLPGFHIYHVSRMAPYPQQAQQPKKWRWAPWPRAAIAYAPNLLFYYPGSYALNVDGVFLSNIPNI